MLSGRVVQQNTLQEIHKYLSPNMSEWFPHLHEMLHQIICARIYFRALNICTIVFHHNMVASYPTLIRITAMHNLHPWVFAERNTYNCTILGRHNIIIYGIAFLTMQVHNYASTQGALGQSTNTFALQLVWL